MNSFYDQFHFLRPLALWLVPVGIVLWLWLARHTVAVLSAWVKACDSHLLKQLFTTRHKRSRKHAGLWLLLCWIIAAVALSGPTWQKHPQAVVETNNPLFILLDVSAEMLATDVTPSRLKRATFKISDMLAIAKDQPAGLAVFTAEPFVVSPVTPDADILTAQLHILKPDIVPVGGKDIGKAINHVVDRLKAGEFGKSQIIILSNGTGGRISDAITAARNAAHKGHIVSVLGIGTKDGAPIPDINRTGFVARSGNVQLTKLEADNLAAIAQAGNGTYISYTASDADIKTILANKPVTITNMNTQQTTKADTWQDSGVYLVPLLLLGGIAATRRGLLLWLVFMFPLLSSTPAQAAWWDNLWQRPDQREAERLTGSKQNSKNNFDASVFTDPAWQGAALYRNGDYEKAKQAFEKAGKDAQALYNTGNALAYMKQYEKAIEHYEKAIKKQPGHADAIYNRDYLKELMQKQKQQQQQQQQQQQGGGQGDKNQQQQSQQNKSSDQKNQPEDSARQSQSQPQDKGDKKSGSKNKSGQDKKSQQSQKPNQPEQTNKQKQNNDQQQKAGAEPDKNKKDPQDMNANARKEGQPNDKKKRADIADRSPMGEDEQAREQLYTRIPDDPGGLLRELFKRRYYRRQQQ